VLAWLAEALAKAARSLPMVVQFATMRGMVKERPASRLLAHRGGLGDDLKWLRDLPEDKPESRDLTPMPPWDKASRP